MNIYNTQISCVVQKKEIRK
ncbi:hypothetical protein Zm00014a_018821 [Zea mays]|uniref:Uncharacterized protein n=1 Tax=Zea mays TaxID=4577 RepID=A0A3L6E3U5_MAIZE|nr:hypothetical protein Zm00014a_018821 [Zea mays]